MRSIRRSVPHIGFALACAVIVALAGFACVHAAPHVSGGVGGDWEIVAAPPLDGQRITALLTSGQDGPWVGTDERGLALWDGSKWRTIGPRAGLPDSRIVALFADRQHRLWVSTGGGLGYLPADGGQFRRIGLSGLSALPVLAFAQASDGAILLGTGRGLSVWQADGALETIPELAGLAVPALHTDRSGQTWAGTSAGLWRQVDHSWQRETGVGDGRVAAIAESPDGRLYVAGQAGVWELRDGVWQALAAPVNGELSALALRDGNVWVGTSQGVIAGQEGIWEAYDTSFLPQAAVTALAWSGDILWVGTSGGLVAYRPDAAPPHVAIASVNGLRPSSGSLSLRSDRIEKIAIEASDGLTPQNRLRIFTRFEGIDAEPRLLTQAERRDLGAVAAYAGRVLAPGSYVLRLWAQDDAFNRSAESQLTIVVPELAHGPAGLTVRRDAAYAGLAGIALLLTAGMTTGAAGRVRRRQAQYAAQAAGAHLRSVADRSAQFYSVHVPVREQEVGEAVAALKHKNLLILGDPGIGKTSMLGRLAATLSGSGDRSSTVAPATVDLATIRESEFFSALVTAAITALHPFAAGSRPRLRWSAGPNPDYGEQEFSADLGLLLAWLQPQLGRPLTLVFLLDNAGRLDGYDGRQRDGFRRLIVATAAARSPVRLVLAADKTPSVVTGFVDLFASLTLAPLPYVAARQLLHGGTLGLLEWEPQAERAAIALSAGNPAQLIAVGGAAARNALSDNRLQITRSDVP